jgi:ABC-type sugar transport system substrate-binding protein
MLLDRFWVRWPLTRIDILSNGVFAFRWRCVRRRALPRLHPRGPQGGKVTRRIRIATAGALVALAALSVSATALLAATTRSAAAPPGYKGVEATLPTAYKKPAKKAGTSCTIGFQNPVAANETLGYWQKSVIAQAKVYGCKVIALDDALSPDKQVSNMQQLLAQNVNVIIFYPLDPKATVPVLKQAKAKGVPVLAVDATFGSPKATAPYLPYITSQVWQGRDIQAFLQAQALAKAKPGAQVGLIGIGAPVPALKYLNQRESFWAKKDGLKVLGTQDNPSDDVTGGEKAANGLLQRYSNMDAVIGYNDPSAIGAYTAARGAGRQLTIVGLNGSSDGVSAVRSGRLAATVQVDPVGWGRVQALAAYNLITKQHLPLPKIIVLPPRLITKANVDKVPSWANQLKAIK